jgi:hypothetical protein
MGGEIVNVENFARAETNRILAAILRDTGGINRWMHNREPTPLDHQPVIRQNRDTLYSASVIDVSKGVTITMPDGGDRYMSAMLVNQDHYVMAVLHEPGEHELSFEQLGTPYVLLAVRTLVDPVDPADVAAANALQDQLSLRAESAEPFVLPDTTRPVSWRPATPCSNWLGCTGSSTPSARPIGSTQSAISLPRPRVGVVCQTRRRCTSTSTPASPSAPTS